MLKYIARFLGGSNEKKVKKALPIVDYINSLEPEFEKFTDDELRAKTEEFKQILNTYNLEFKDNKIIKKD